MAKTPETQPFAVEQVDRLLGQLAFQISRILRPHDSSSVHNLRIAVRRFARALRVFGPCFPAKDVKKIGHRLEEIMAPAREWRDCDLAIHLLSGSKAAEATALQARLERQRKDAEHMLLGTLRRWMERKTSLKWRTRLKSAFVARGDAAETAAEMLPDLAREFFDRGRQAVNAGSSADAFHQFHGAAKKFRYTLELFAPLYNSALRVWVERVKSVHTLASRIDDGSAVRKTFAQGGRIEAVDAELEKKQRKQIDEFRREWKESFSSPDHAREWIHYLQNSAGKPSTARKPMARSAAASNVSGRNVQRA
jgi:CHAD domain-containing protein